MSESFSVDYSFTITLRPKCFTHEPEIQYDDTNFHVRARLASISPHFTIVAEVTKAWNIHYHGIIKFVLKDKVDCAKRFHARFRNDNLVGFVNIKQITDYNGWCEYIVKDLQKTTESIGRRPIIRDDYGVTNPEQRAKYAVIW